MSYNINSDRTTNEDFLDARRAQTLAGWSYIGIVIPLVGWILAGMSLSVSKDLPTNGKIGKRRRSARSNATLSILLSVVASFIWIGVIDNAASSSKQQQSQQAVQSTPAQTVDNQQAALQACIDQAHREWDGDIAIAEGGLDQEPYNFDKSQLDQQLNLCHEQYGY
jgi:hypothetical protein